MPPTHPSPRPRIERIRTSVTGKLIYFILITCGTEYHINPPSSPIGRCIIDI